MPILASRRCVVFLASGLFVTALVAAPLVAQIEDGSQTAERFARFAQQMSGVVLTGSYTDQSGESHEDQYEIFEAKKMPAGDLWVFKARICYGDKDVTLPVPIEVKWLGQTPVLTLDQVTLPALGTFSAYVVVDGDRYAGTWRHDEKGGHLFGTIRSKTAAESTPPSD